MIYPSSLYNNIQPHFPSFSIVFPSFSIGFPSFPMNFPWHHQCFTKHCSGADHPGPGPTGAASACRCDPWEGGLWPIKGPNNGHAMCFGECGVYIYIYYYYIYIYILSYIYIIIYIYTHCSKPSKLAKQIKIYQSIHSGVVIVLSHTHITPRLRKPLRKHEMVGQSKKMGSQNTRGKPTCLSKTP